MSSFIPLHSNVKDYEALKNLTSSIPDEDDDEEAIMCCIFIFFGCKKNQIICKLTCGSFLESSALSFSFGTFLSVLSRQETATDPTLPQSTVTRSIHKVWKVTCAQQGKFIAQTANNRNFISTYTSLAKKFNPYSLLKSFCKPPLYELKFRRGRDRHFYYNKSCNVCLSPICWTLS